MTCNDSFNLFGLPINQICSILSNKTKKWRHFIIIKPSNKICKCILQGDLSQYSFITHASFCYNSKAFQEICLCTLQGDLSQL